MVSRICREMVTRYGFSSLGPVAFEADGGEVFLGRDWLRPEPHYSRQTGNRIDQQVRAQATEALDRAVAMLSPRRELMDQLVNLLIEQETLEGDAFRALVASYETTGKANVQAAQVGL